MEGFEFKKVQIGKEILAYREGGLGDRVLVLVHGNMSSSLHFDKLMEALKNDFKIYAVDLRGFGYSSYHNRFDSLKDLSEDLELFIDKIRISNFDLLGWSTGGGIVMQYTADNPDLVNRLILMESVGIEGYPMTEVAPDGSPTNKLQFTKEEMASDPMRAGAILAASNRKDKAFYKAMWDAAIYNVGNYPEPEDYDRYNEEILLQRNLVDIYYALAYFNISNNENAYGKGSGDVYKIKCPVDIIQGKDDLVVPQPMGEGIYKALKDHATYHLLDHCGHNPMVDQFEKVLKIIKNDKE